MISLAFSDSPFSIIYVGVSEPNKKISTACKTENRPVKDKIILQAYSKSNASIISSITITIKTPTILPKLKNKPNSFRNYFGAIYLR